MRGGGGRRRGRVPRAALWDPPGRLPRACLAQQSGLRAGMRGVVQLPAALRGPEAESLGVGSGPPPAPVTA